MSLDSRKRLDRVHYTYRNLRSLHIRPLDNEYPRQWHHIEPDGPLSHALLIAAQKSLSCPHPFCCRREAARASDKRLTHQH